MVRNPLLSNDMLYLKDPHFRTHIFQNEKFKTKLFKKNRKFDFTETKYVKPLMKNRMLNEMFNEIVPPILKEDDICIAINSPPSDVTHLNLTYNHQSFSYLIGTPLIFFLLILS